MAQDRGGTVPGSERPTVWDLFHGFMLLGLMGFGGVLPLARHKLVDQKKWITPTEFLDLLGLCQFLPGGNIINMGVAVGLKFRGPMGAFASVLGLLMAPTLIAMCFASIYGHFADVPIVKHLFEGLAAAAAGLLVALAVKLVGPLWRQPLACLLAAICFVLIALFRVSLIEVMLILTPISILVRYLARA